MIFKSGLKFQTELLQDIKQIPSNELKKTPQLLSIFLSDKLHFLSGF